jgi:hypothetical protein
MKAKFYLWLLFLLALMLGVAVLKGDNLETILKRPDGSRVRIMTDFFESRGGLVWSWRANHKKLIAIEKVTRRSWDQVKRDLGV